MSEVPEPLPGEAEPVHRTAPLGLLVRLVDSARQAILPIVAALFGLGELREAIGILPMIALGLVVVGFFTWLGWWRTTYRIGEEDIRVESGVVSRQARSVPYERIQDVSLEQPLIARAFGLVRVKFETGAGGGEDLNLAYVSESEAERLREVVRERKEDAAEDDEEIIEQADAPALFAMDQKRLLTFGLFEFSLVIFAVLLGAAQQFEFLLPFNLFQDGIVEDAIEGQWRQLLAIGLAGQVFGGLAGLVGVVLLGLATGVIQTVIRDYGFRLDRTAKGFRRRRGLFTKTDVVMPAHRVQAMTLGTNWFRRLFGWHSLKFVSLANDAKSSSHVVVPFGQMEEIAPVARAARIALPPADIDWQCPTFKAWTDSAGVLSLVLLASAAVVAATVSPTAMIAPLPVIAAIWALSWLGWRRHRHATALEQLFKRHGILAPKVTTAQKIKLQSVEIAQGPIARLRGYATMHFGLAGGTLAIPGVPLTEARRLRAEVLDAIAAVDFSDLPDNR